MKGTKLWRTFHEGVRNFRRNGWLTAATVVVLTLSLFIVSLTALLGVTTNLILADMQEKVSINVAFAPGVEEERILSIGKDLERYKEIASVEYVSRDKALEDFLANGGSDPVISQALQEIGGNPLLASLTIKARNPDDYELIAGQIAKAPFKDEIERINYEKNKKVIDKLNAIKKSTKDAGLALGALFVGIALLITFNTIRINMHSRRNEFEIMRLVGASNLYMRMPQVFEGVFYGLSAAGVTAVLLFATARFFSPVTGNILPQGSLLDYYLAHFWTVLGALALLGTVLGALSGFVAVRRYLKI
jgi:cell division transport system permease protein